MAITTQEFLFKLFEIFWNCYFSDHGKYYSHPFNSMSKSEMRKFKELVKELLSQFSDFLDAADFDIVETRERLGHGEGFLSSLIIESVQKSKRIKRLERALKDLKAAGKIQEKEKSK